MKRGLILGVATLALVAGVACSPGNNFRDKEGVPSHDADSYLLINNVDGHPNIVRVCVDGVAFITTTREYTAIMRVPEFDAACEKENR